MISYNNICLLHTHAKFSPDESVSGFLERLIKFTIDVSDLFFLRDTFKNVTPGLKCYVSKFYLQLTKFCRLRCQC